MRTDTVVTACIGNNADLFPNVLAIYVPLKSRVLDMTWGKGVFWRNVDTSLYDLVRNDLFEAADVHENFRKMSFLDESFDAVVLDPPYMRTNNKHGVMASNYRNRDINLRTHTAIIELYKEGATEAWRLLRSGGVLIIKCQDEVESRRQRWSHVELMSLDGFLCEDLFVLVRSGIPLRGRCQDVQHHGRKNHSFFVIHRKVLKK